MNKQYTYGEMLKVAQNGEIFSGGASSSFAVIIKGETKEVLWSCFSRDSWVPADKSWQDKGYLFRRTNEFLDIKYEITRRFAEVSVELNGDHLAVVTANCVKVGCQTFTFEAVEKLAAEVAKARAFNKAS